MAYESVSQPTAKKARVPFRLLTIVVVIVAALVVYFQWQLKEEPFVVTVEIIGDGEQALTTLGGTVADLLNVAQIEVGPHDVVVPGLDEVAVPELHIRIERAIPVQVVVDGGQDTHWVIASTVRQALDKLGISLNPLDRLSPSQNTALEPNINITIVRVVEEFIEETETLPFKVVRWAAPELERGQTQVIREGREGIIQNRVRVVYEDGRPINRTIVGSQVVQSVVDRVIGEGTRTPSKTVSTPNGPLAYIEEREMVATGYEPGPISTGEWADGLTFTGLKAQRGVIAVDPTVIPLGTRLYVEGYGEGIAADIGGAIKGNRLDLCFDTYNEAIQWGRKTVKVYILAP